MSHADNDNTAPVAANFIRHIIDEDRRNGKYGGKVVTRFPPEPNGYLHIGHAKSICLNFGLARDYNGLCFMRFEDTNPEKESQEYVDAILASVRWLGFDWGDRLRFTSDYLEQLYDFAVKLIQKEKAYVCHLNAEEMSDYRGTFTQAGRESPYRGRSIAENLSEFQKMRRGVYRDGEAVLRAKIDMAAPNLNMRDPVLFRIKHTPHYRQDSKWCIYPSYDFNECLSDYLEGVTHSICTLEFEDHRPLYEWILQELEVVEPPCQYEFARLCLDYTVMSKRKLIRLVEEKYVNGWDDPRLSTLAGFRRRGYTPESIRQFCDRIGIAKSTARIDLSVLENCVREDLDKRAPRAMAVLRPLRVVIENYPEEMTEMMEAANHPHFPEWGKRAVPFTREIYIERDDFMENPPKGYNRLVPQGEVRLRCAYIIKCEKVIKDAAGEVIELRCSYDPATRSGGEKSGRKVKGTIHWVSASQAVPVEVRLYNRLFTEADPDAHEDFTTCINPDSVEILKPCYVEPSLANAAPESRYQFERLGYFCVDMVDSQAAQLVFNRVVTLRDGWTGK